MGTYVVVCVNLLDSSIDTKQCDAQDWKSALQSTYPGVYKYVEEASTLEDACDIAFEGEMLIDVLSVQ